MRGLDSHSLIVKKDLNVVVLVACQFQVQEKRARFHKDNLN